jgi:hypothetical protein
MTQAIAAAGQPWVPGRFTFSGKGRAAVRAAAWPAAASTAFLALLLTGPAPARAEIGPTSSASVGIQISVAPKFGLASRPQAMASGFSGRYCIDTNGERMALPILLIQSSPGQSREASEPLPWCRPEGSAAVGNAERDAGDRVSSLLIIRPE